MRAPLSLPTTPSISMYTMIDDQNQPRSASASLPLATNLHHPHPHGIMHHNNNMPQVHNALANSSSSSPASSSSSSSYASIIAKAPVASSRPPQVPPKCRKFSKAKQDAFKQALHTETGVPGVYLSYFRRYCDEQLRYRI